MQPLAHPVAVIPSVCPASSPAPPSPAPRGIGVMWFSCPRAQVRGGYSFSWGSEFRGMVNGNQSRMCFVSRHLEQTIGLSQPEICKQPRHTGKPFNYVKSLCSSFCCSQVKDYSRKRWLILSLLSVEIDMMITWLTPLDLADREMTVLQVLLTRFSSSSSI